MCYTANLEEQNVRYNGVPNDSKRNLPLGFLKNRPGISVFENFLISENFEFETVRESNAIWALLTTSTIYNR